MKTWEKRRVQYSTRVVATQTNPAELDDAEVVHYSIPAIQETGGPIIERASLIESNKLLLQGGEVLVSRLNPHKNCVTRVAQHEMPILCSTEFVAFTADSINARYLEYSFRSPFISQYLASCAESATRSHSRVDPAVIIKLKIPQPDSATQDQVADYLDGEIRHIDDLIAEKEKMLALLDEKWAALVSRAVTRGLDPDVPLKPSGVEWLGEIPRRWEVRRLKFLLERIDQGWSPQCHNIPAEEGAWGVLKTGCVNGGVFHEDENKALPEGIAPPENIEVGLGDVLMSRASGSVDLIGSVAMVRKQPGPRLLLSDKTFRLRPKRDSIAPSFLVAVMGSAALRFQIKGFISGAEGLANNIPRTDIGELIVPLPPLQEQNKIMASLTSEAERTTDLEACLSGSISLLRERRSALITAAVTGQVPLEAMSA